MSDKKQFGMKYEPKQFGMPVQPKSFDTGNAPVQPVAPEKPKEDVEETIAGGGAKTYDDVYNQLIEAQQTKYDKDAEALARKRRSQELIGGIADAASSLANIYYTTKGSPNAFDPTQGMSAKARERYAMAKAELDKANNSRMAYLTNLESARRSSRKQDLDERRLNYYEDRERRLANDAANKAAYNDAILELKRQAQQAKNDLDAKRIDIAQYNAETKRIQAEANRLYKAHGGSGRGLQPYVIYKSNDGMGNQMEERITYDENGNVMRINLGGTPSSNGAGGSGKTQSNLYSKGKKTNGKEHSGLYTRKN